MTRQCRSYRLLSRNRPARILPNRRNRSRIRQNQSRRNRKNQKKHPVIPDTKIPKPRSRKFSRCSALEKFLPGISLLRRTARAGCIWGRTDTGGCVFRRWEIYGRLGFLQDCSSWRQQVWGWPELVQNVVVVSGAGAEKRNGKNKKIKGRKGLAVLFAL